MYNELISSWPFKSGACSMDITSSSRRPSRKKTAKIIKTHSTQFAPTPPAMTIFNYNWSNFNIPGTPRGYLVERRCFGCQRCRNKKYAKIGLAWCGTICPVCFHPCVAWRGCRRRRLRSVSHETFNTHAEDRNLNVCGARKGISSSSCSFGAFLMWCCNIIWGDDPRRNEFRCKFKV